MTSKLMTATKAKTTAQRKARGQRVPEAKLATPEAVKSAVNARTGNGLVVTTTADRSIVITRVDARVNKLAKAGQSIAPLEEYLKTQPKPVAHMARGTDAHTAPHSAKAVADQKRSETKPHKGKVRMEKAAKAKQPARGGNRAYTLAGRKDESKPDTFRRYMLSTIMGCKDTDSAKAAHAKSHKYPTHKLDFNWAAQQGYIKFN